MFAPLHTVERHNDPKWNRADRTFYDSGALTLLRKTAPLLVDHDRNRQVGTVDMLYRMEWTDGPWLCASATVTDPPSWLSRDTRASFAFIPFQRSSFIRAGEADHVRKAWVTEVSVLSPGIEPAEPLARVMSLRKADPVAARSASHWPPGTIVRNLPDGTQEITHTQRHIIRRPGGRVLAVH